jgi:CRP-like cAMP-binding protein
MNNDLTHSNGLPSIITAVKLCPLFAGIPEDDLASLLSCLAAVRRSYDKGKYIFSEGQRPETVGIVISGRVHILKEDVWGNRNLLAEISTGDMFAEAMVCAAVDELPISVVAVECTQTLQLDYKRIITTCHSACGFHSSLIANMLRVLARKNIQLVDKMEHITKRTTREKLLSYLSEQSKQGGAREFDIPFDRQRLADYLSVERSALSAELSRMQADGVISYHKNHFVLR